MTEVFEKLVGIVKSGLLLHGSPKKFDVLQGKPLHATDVPAYASLMAILPRGKTMKHLKFAKTKILAPPDVIKGLGPGFVYAVSKDLFKAGKSHSFEYVTWEPVGIVDCIEVVPEDFPFEISPASDSAFRSLKVAMDGPARRGFRNSYRG